MGEKNQSESVKGISAQTLSLPKGGGAVKGLGESFKPDSFSGTGNYSIPIPITPARGFEPNLTLNYNSGYGNGVYGIGFSLNLSSISVRTDKGTPKYNGTEIYLLQDVGELVKKLTESNNEFVEDVRTEEIDGVGFTVEIYLPRIEESFNLIEKWINNQSGETFWKTISKENITSFYGKSDSARIANPESNEQIFKWLIEESFDPKGNKIQYSYKEENDDNVPKSIWEVNRQYKANKYLTNIKYGNFINEENSEEFAFEIVFDYGEYDLSRLTKKSSDPYLPVKNWECRPDPFSSYRSGFEIRTYRRCLNILLFHNFKNEIGEHCLVKRLAIRYINEIFYMQIPINSMSQINSVQLTGYIKNDGGSYYDQKLPPLKLKYSPFVPAVPQVFGELKAEENPIPGLLDNSQFITVDLNSEGIPGLLFNNNTLLYFEPKGDGNYSSPVIQENFPVHRNIIGGKVSLVDIDGNGELELLVNDESGSGYYKHKDNFSWEAFQTFEDVPFGISNPDLEQTDLDGNGKTDLLLIESNELIIYQSKGTKGFNPAKRITNKNNVPILSRGSKSELVTFADMSGDGLTDKVKIRNGVVEYWPNLSYGRFSEKVTLGNSPRFENYLDIKRILLADIDGSGTTDIIYVFSDRVEVYINQNGNSFSNGITVILPDEFSDIDQIKFADVLGNGTACMIFTKISPVPVHYYYNFIGDITLDDGSILQSMKPYLLYEINNNLGSVVNLQYCSSTKFYLEDKKSGRGWITKLHFPVQVVEKIICNEKISGSRFINKFKYHDGYYDTVEKEFRGFGFVESWDTETYEEFKSITGKTGQKTENLSKELYVPPVYTKTWYHTGAFIERDSIIKCYKQEYFSKDKSEYNFPDSVFRQDIYNYDAETLRQAYVALKGHVLRKEVYGSDNSPISTVPYSVDESNFEVVLFQPKQNQLYGVFYTIPRESISYHYERNENDPRVQQDFVLEVDELSGGIKKACSVYLPRRSEEITGCKPCPEQEILKITAKTTGFIDTQDSEDFRWRGVPYEQQQFEVFGGNLDNALYMQFDSIKEQVNSALQNIVPYSGSVKPNTPQARQLSWIRSYFWNETQTDLNPLGQISSRGLVHHKSEAVFTGEFISNIYGGLLSDSIINREGGYIFDSNTGYWWNNGLVQNYFNESSKFYLPAITENSFSDNTSMLYKKTSLDYDSPYFLRPIGVKQFLDIENFNEMSAQINYTNMQIQQIIDFNNNVRQVLFDPLGQVTVASLFGEENGTKSGGMILLPVNGQPAEYTRRTTTQDGKPISFIDVLENSEYYLQGATEYSFYNLFAWKESNQPACSVELVRENYYRNGDNISDFSCNTILKYSDGLGKIIEEKIKTDPGTSFIWDIQGTLLVDKNNLPVEKESDERWAVSGRVVYNNKSKPCKEYLPYFSNIAVYELQSEIAGSPPAIIHYDPLLRIVRTETPKGFFSKTEFTPWEEIHYDEDDTVRDSTFYISFINNYPDDPTLEQKNEKDALDKAAVFCNTPLVKRIDNTGSVFNEIQTKADGSTLTTYFETDIEGRIVKSIDPRLYKSNLDKGTHYFNFHFVYTMGAKKPIRTEGTENGTNLNFNDIFSNTIWFLSPRNYNQRKTFDRLQRITSVRVKKIVPSQPPVSISNYNLVEVYTYGETVANAQNLNLRGQLYEIKDLSGIVVHSRYNIAYDLLATTRQMTSDYANSVNWDNKVSLQPDIYSTSYTYDALKHSLTEETSDGTVISNTYNQTGLLKTISVKLNNGTLQQAVNNIEYDAKQQRTLLQYGNGAATTYIYEPTTLRLIKQTSTKQGSNSNVKVQDLGYTYDPVGNITRLIDNSYKTVFNNNQVVKPLSDYTYDALYRLIKADGRQHPGITTNTYKNNQQDNDFKQSRFFQLPSVNDSDKLENYSESYTYDDAGNLVNKQHAAASQTWTRQTKVAADSNHLEGYEYDASGNQKQLFINSSVGLVFNCCENLVKAGIITRPGQPDDCDYYNYDSSEMRTRKVSQRMEHAGTITSLEEKIYLGDYEVKRVKSMGSDGNETVTLERHSVRVMDDETCVLIIHSWKTNKSHPELENTNQYRFQLDNNIGSAVIELDKDAQLISYEEFFPYGGTAFIAGKNQAEVKLKDYRYSGKERDDSTGFYYYGARYYAPWLGRWLKPDPEGTVDGLNLYAFVGNNPITFKDEDGNARTKQTARSGKGKLRKSKSAKTRAIEHLQGVRLRHDKLLGLTGLTMADIAEMLSHEMGRRVRLTDIRLIHYRQQARKDLDRSQAAYDQFSIPPSASSKPPSSTVNPFGVMGGSFTGKTEYREQQFMVSKSSLNVDGRDSTNATMASASSWAGTSNLAASAYSGRDDSGVILGGLGEAWCHLIAHCLGGPESAENLVAGSQGSNLVQLGIERAISNFVAATGNKVFIRVGADLRVKGDGSLTHIAEKFHYQIFNETGTAIYSTSFAANIRRADILQSQKYHEALAAMEKHFGVALKKAA